MDINPKDLTECEFRILIVEKLDALLENNQTTTKRLDSHSSQIKAIWGMGGLSGLVAAWIGAKTGSH